MQNVPHTESVLFPEMGDSEKHIVFKEDGTKAGMLNMLKCLDHRNGGTKEKL